VAQNKHLGAVHLNEPSPHRRIAFVLRPNYTRVSSIDALISLCKAALSNKGAGKPAGKK
jgi:LysR family transcriptional regulator, hydrogen peroxide-inducible genes activator